MNQKSTRARLVNRVDGKRNKILTNYTRVDDSNVNNFEKQNVHSGDILPVLGLLRLARSFVMLNLDCRIRFVCLITFSTKIEKYKQFVGNRVVFLD